MTGISERWPRWLALAGGLCVLNLALSFHNLWPTAWVRPGAQLSVELAVLVLGLALWSESGRPPGRRSIRWLALLLTLFVIGRYLAVTAPALFGRQINLFWDAKHMPDVVAMLAEETAPWLLTLLGLAVVVGLGLLYGLVFWGLDGVRRGLSEAAPRRLLIAVSGLLLLLYGGGQATDWQTMRDWFVKPVSLTYAEQAAFLWDAATGGAATQALPTSPRMDSDLKRVAAADVIILFSESYGAITYDSPTMARALEAPRANLAAALEATGRGAVSAFVRSPTFGGYSWLAHVSLLSGIEVSENPTYDLLLTQRRDTLVHRFARAGYRTIGVMPGLRKVWPEGAFYGFDRLLDARGLGYQGPAFGWWRIPDQFSMAKLDARELSTGDGRPRFVFFPTVSSHMPFRPTPPYQPDWERILTADPFAGTALAEALAERPDWGNLKPDYTGSIAYTFTWLAGYLRHRPGLDLVLVVLGDHQPPARVAGRDITWDVPVHVISSRAGILDALTAEGFRRGLTPTRPSLGNMAELTALLLRAFDGGPHAPAPGATPRRAAEGFRSHTARDAKD
jgi:hypothetical protein